MPDPGLPGALILIVAVVIAAAAVWFVDRLARRSTPRSGALHGIGRDDTVGYFRDYEDKTGAPGVREEDRTGRWGKGDSGSG